MHMNQLVILSVNQPVSVLMNPSLFSMEMRYGEGSVSGGVKDADYMDADTCSSPRAKIFLVMTVSFVVAAVVVLAVICMYNSFTCLSLVIYM